MFFKFILISIYVCNCKAEEILIRDLSSINYLEKSFRNNFPLFPNRLKFSLHLTRIPGLLFYSIDKNLNQLIVKIHDEFNPFLTIELNRKKFLISLKELCRCERCMYERLDFRFQLKNGINVQCNEGEVFKNKYSPNQNFESKYPIPNFNKNVSAFLWMINTPEFESKVSKIYPENEFITGCIFEISHNDVPIDMDKFGVGISNKCNKQCNTDICNGGKCLETYDLKPICDCLQTYRNGDFCNSSHVTTDMYNDGFQFEVLKMSWKSNLREILHLSSKYVLLVITVQDNGLCFKYLEIGNTGRGCLNILPGNYLFGKEYVLILTLDYRSLIIQVILHFNNSYTINKFSTNLTLNKEEFDKIIFLNNSIHEVGDIVFKVSKKETKWRHIGNNINKTNEKDRSVNDPTNRKFVNKVVRGEIMKGSIFHDHPLLYFIIGFGIGTAFTLVIVGVIVHKCPSCFPTCVREKVQLIKPNNDEIKSSTDVLVRHNSVFRGSSITLSKANGVQRNSSSMLRGSTDLLRGSSNVLRGSTDGLLRNNSITRRSNDALRTSNDPHRRSHIILRSSSNTLYLPPNNINRLSRIDV